MGEVWDTETHRNLLRVEKEAAAYKLKDVKEGRKPIEAVEGSESASLETQRQQDWLASCRPLLFRTLTECLLF